MKFTITVRKIEIYNVPVEADSLEDAKEAAMDLIGEGANAGDFHSDSDMEADDADPEPED